ncbi:hypothetical protein K439DRAFT_1628102 [Ramaria rubella]|nr:hypothetical protein K439DRAFT_1628102 [Ramaria rubella]
MSYYQSFAITSLRSCVILCVAFGGEPQVMPQSVRNEDFSCHLVPGSERTLCSGQKFRKSDHAAAKRKMKTL